MNLAKIKHSNGGPDYADTEAKDQNATGSPDIIGRRERRRRGPRFWRDLATDLLNQACHLLSEHDVAFLANVQQAAHRGIVPTAAQISWVRNIQERLKDRANVS